MKDLHTGFAVIVIDLLEKIWQFLQCTTQVFMFQWVEFSRAVYKIKIKTLPHGVIGKGASLVTGIRPVRFPAPAYRFPCKKGLPLSVTT